MTLEKQFNSKLFRRKISDFLFLTCNGKLWAGQYVIVIRNYRNPNNVSDVGYIALERGSCYISSTYSILLQAQPLTFKLISFAKSLLSSLALRIQTVKKENPFSFMP